MVAVTPWLCDFTLLKHQYRCIIYFYCRREIRDLSNVSEYISVQSNLALSKDDLLFFYPPKGKEAKFLTELRKLLGIDAENESDILSETKKSDCFAIVFTEMIKDKQKFKAKFCDLSQHLRQPLNQSQILQTSEEIYSGSFHVSNTYSIAEAFILKPSLFGFGLDLAKLYEVVSKNSIFQKYVRKRLK